MTRKVSHGRFAQPCPGVDVNCIDDIIGAMDSILTRRCKEQATIRGKGKSSKEGGELVRIDIFERSQAQATQTWRCVGHDCWKREGWGWRC